MVLCDRGLEMSHQHTQMSCGLVVDNVEQDLDMNKDDDLVSILSQ